MVVRVVRDLRERARFWERRALPGLREVTAPASLYFPISRVGTSIISWSRCKDQMGCNVHGIQGRG